MYRYEKSLVVIIGLNIHSTLVCKHLNTLKSQQFVCFTRIFI